MMAQSPPWGSQIAIKKKVPLKMLQFENMDSRNGTFSSTYWKFTEYVVAPLISLFADTNNYLGVRICSAISASWRELSVLGCAQRHRGEGEPESLCRNSLSCGAGRLGITISRDHSCVAGHISGANILKGCSIGLIWLNL